MPKQVQTPAKRRRRRPAPKSATQIRAWQDDPDSGLATISDPLPTFGTPPLAVAISGQAPPVATYPTGSNEFRYWTAAEALTRAADLWAGILPRGTGWQPGGALTATLNAGTDLNAYYDRQGLSFFSKRVGERTIHSGESPDVVCHELGHAVLDAVKPDLWDAASDEIAAFHEGFADCSAILSALQLPTVRDSLIDETDGALYRTSRVSRLAEQLGAGIRASRPDLVEPDCLRNAVNAFVYHPPEELPHSAPAWNLSSEPHSFSRVWTGGFFEALAKMVGTGPQPTAADVLLDTATDAAQLLVDAVFDASVVPDFYSQVAAHMIEADRRRFRGRYRDALKSAFVRRGILSLDSLPLLKNSARRGRAGRGMVGEAASAEAARPVAIAAGDFGLGKQQLMVQAAQEPKRLEVRAAAFVSGAVSAAPAGDAARSFVEDLFKRGRVDVGDHGDPEVRVIHPGTRKTHDVVTRDGGLALTRRAFDCGFGID